MTAAVTTPEAGSVETGEPLLRVRNLSKTYVDANGNRSDVLAGVDLTVAEGELVAVLGFSGSGKTTLVSAIAGLVPIDRGEITIDGAPIDGPGRDRGVVFQSYSLPPWLSVWDNVKLSVDAVHSGRSRAERNELIAATIELVGLSHAKDRRMAQLSGGMRQRTALARALAGTPRILLMDEPLSALDALTRSKLQDEIDAIRAREKTTVLLVTNDVDEALLLADRVAVLERGPRAGIARLFEVDIDRPRDRTELQHDLRFMALRNEIVTFLAELGVDPDLVTTASTPEGPVEVATLPDVAPTDLEPPRAYSDAAAADTEHGYLSFSKLTKVYPTPDGPLTVIEDIDLSLQQGEFVSLIGHSGCGKSTALTMAAGLNEITGGTITLDGRDVHHAGPDKAVVFQAPSLFPWLTARDNVALGVERVYPDATRKERKEIVEYYLQRVGLGDAMEKRAGDLSNGMKQRVGLARAFALSPKLLLLDEPFGMLDSLTRWDLQDVLVEVWNRTQVTTICVTHDVDEAILLADRVIMMTNGPNARIGSVLEVDLPRPRDRKQLLEDPKFYGYREQVLEFLEAYEHGNASSAT
ncbi:MAG: nitrate ABC transporter ATP-binding protein [Actinomycetota bacterium]